MSNRLRQCLRLTHVRSIQHGLAAVAADHAVRRVEALQMSADQLARLRGGFGAEPGFSSGAVLASIGEIAMRLDIAREGLTKSINGARDHAATTREARLAARRKQESTQRLTEKAVADAACKAEKKLMAPGRRRSPRTAGEPQ